MMSVIWNIYQKYVKKMARNYAVEVKFALAL